MWRGCQLEGEELGLAGLHLQAMLVSLSLVQGSILVTPLPTELIDHGDSASKSVKGQAGIKESVNSPWSTTGSLL